MSTKSTIPPRGRRSSESGWRKTCFSLSAASIDFRVEDVSPFFFGLPDSGASTARSHRGLLHADLRLRYARVFVQVAAAGDNGRDVQRPFDESLPDLQRGFFDLSFGLDSLAPTLRVGRQEIPTPNRRQLAVREALNLRLAFDGLHFFGAAGRFRYQAFAGAEVINRPEAFDDQPDDERLLFGGYLTWEFAPAVTLEAYYHGKTIDELQLAQVSGDETRHMIGLRSRRKFGRFDYDIEAAYQYGEIGGETISALGFGSTFGLSLRHRRRRHPLAHRRDDRSAVARVLAVRCNPASGGGHGVGREP
ncbi:MAG: alginate export family protein [Myxococcota bacterium]